MFTEIIHSEDKNVCWNLLRKHVRYTTKENLQLVAEKYEALTTAFFYEDYRTIKRTTVQTESQRKEIKRQRRKQIIALRHIDPILCVEKGTWYFLIINSLAQMVYCLKRMGEPCREHVGNNFSPVPNEYIKEFLVIRDEIVNLIVAQRAYEMNSKVITASDQMLQQANNLRG